ncbi:MAG: tRNA (uridine(34)/cytosine(34)/5-carboxymethylaminomethyluridine(34)-2'-O)-methyltransferase TrmL [Betaproteobacteria bacterium]|nr:tRNA (uridine(34)/cytosine(34)/5-carboxymethylaminomethyluridine(34)-2'-O)-methyltransferase TrmL [Betaproteobacteria bacterium]
MLDVVLYQPEIPPNTGNIIRLCVNTGCTLHLVKPLGFQLDDRRLARAGLDYADMASVVVHRNWQQCLAHFAGRRMFAATTRGEASHAAPRFLEGDALVFGPETRGLPHDVLDGFSADRRLRIPMLPGNRSLNLSNAVAIAVYEAWRQHNFKGARQPDLPGV